MSADSSAAAEGRGGARGSGGREGSDPLAPSAAAAVPAEGAAVVRTAGVTEVSGMEGSLLEAIAAKKVEKPKLMIYNDWLGWRKTSQSRPTKKKDGKSTTSAEESELWKQVMENLYGSDWRKDLDAQEMVKAVAAADEAEEVEEEEEPKVRAASKESKKSRATSIASSMPGSPGELRKKLLGESVGELSTQELEARLMKIAAGLEQASEPLTTEELQYVMMKASYVRMIKDLPRAEQQKVLNGREPVVVPASVVAAHVRNKPARKSQDLK